MFDIHRQAVLVTVLFLPISEIIPSFIKQFMSIYAKFIKLEGLLFPVL